MYLNGDTGKVSNGVYSRIASGQSKNHAAFSARHSSLINNNFNVSNEFLYLPAGKRLLLTESDKCLEVTHTV